MRLVPKQDSFFELFEKQVKMVNHGAQCLAALLLDFANVEDAAFRLKATEHDADEIAHEIMKKLNMTFVTPIDREDIHALASALDDILDYIEATVDRMALYEIKEPTVAVIKLSKILTKATELTVQAVCGLRHPKRASEVRELCVAINRLENEADQINRVALSKLFQMHDKPIEALKWREIHEHLETAMDKCEDVADIIEAVILKNA